MFFVLYCFVFYVFQEYFHLLNCLGDSVPLIPTFMETELAQLSINEEEEEILQIQEDVQSYTDVGDYQLVGCFLTASIINFSAMKSTLANLRHPIHGGTDSRFGGKKVLI